MKQISGDLLQRATLFTLTLRAWGNRRKTDLEQVTVEADKRMLSMTKKLVESEEYEAVLRFEHELKQWCLARCMPSFLKDGIFVVALTEVERFEQRLKNSRVELRALVEAFIAKYPQEVEAARATLDVLFNESDYPSETQLRNSFDISWRWISFGVPDNLPPGVKEQEVEKLQKAFKEAQEEITTALRMAFGDLVAHAVEKLTIEPGRPAPKFKDSLLKNFDEFFDTFQARNLMEDDELKAAVEQAKNILSGVEGKSLRKDTEVRTNVAAAFTNVKKEVDRLIVEMPSRRFQFDEE